MSPLLAAALALLAGADLPLPAGAPLGPAVARLAPGDTLRLGPGEHRGSLGRLSGVAVRGAGAGVTVVLAPEGEDGAVVTGDVTLGGLSLVAGPHRSALKVLGGTARLDDVALVGGAAGAYLDEGRLEGREVVLDGEYGLLLAHGVARLSGVTASGRSAGLALMRGELDVTRAAVTGPSSEAGITLAGGSARLAQVVVRDPGPTGVAVSRATLVASDLTVSGPRGADGFFGDCLQVRRGELTLTSSELVRCGGAAVEGSRSRIRLEGVDAAGGEAGGLVFTDESAVDLAFTLATGQGPGLVVLQGSKVRAFGARAFTDPAMWVDCGGGGRVEVLDAPKGPQPCAKAP